MFTLYISDDEKELQNKFIPVVFSYPTNNFESSYYKAEFYKTRDGVGGILDAEPTEFLQAVATLMSVDRSYAGFSSINPRTVINFYEEPNPATKLAFTFNFYSIGSSSIKAFLGYKRNSIGFVFENISYSNSYYFLINQSYPSSSLGSLLSVSREKALVETNNKNANNWLAYPNNSLFELYFTNENLDYYRTVNFEDYSWNVNRLNNKRPGLTTWHNWFTMVTGKYYYGSPFVIELDTEVNGIKEIELTVTTSFNFVDEGLATEKTFTYKNEEISNTAYGFRYYNLGTDISQLFDDNDVVYFKSGGYLQRRVIDSSGTLIFELISGDEGFAIQFGDGGVFVNPNIFNNDNLNYSDCNGVYLSVAYNYATSPASEWLNSIADDYNKFEYANAPLFFSTNLTNTSGFISDNYILSSYVNYEASFKNGPMLAYNLKTEYSQQWMSANREMPISYTFWETLLLGLFPQGEINIGGGSIGGGNSTTGGGSGEFDDSSDNIDFPSVISSSVSNSLFKSYLISESNLNALGNWLHGDAVGILNIEPYQNAIIALKQFYLPGSPLGSEQDIQILDKTVQFRNEEGSGTVTGFVPNNRYLEFDAGSFEFKEYFGSFLDYNPYTKIQLYLPFSGLHDISTNLVMNNKIELKAIVDLLTGVLTYNILVEGDGVNSIIYTFTGNCSSDIPITATDYSGKITAIATTAIGAATSIFTGGASIPLVAAAGGALSIASNQGDVLRSSNVGSVMGAMSVRKPYVIITRPKTSLPVTYQETVGYPSNISSGLSTLKGYSEFSNIHLENITGATDDEISEIESLLKSGVIF